MPARKQIFRRKLLILPEFQLVLIVVNLAVVLVMAIVIWVSVRNTFTELQPVSGLSGIEVQFYQSYLDYQASRFQMAMFLALLSGALISVLVTLVVSHRLAGPLIRLRGFFRSIRNGDEPIPSLQFRDGDYCSDLPDLINDSVKRLRGSSGKVDT